jgi:hypothetical protein
LTLLAAATRASARGKPVLTHCSQLAVRPVLALAWILGASVATVHSAVLQVGPDKPYKTVRAAAQAVRDGDTVEIDAGIYSRDVATWRASNISIRGVGEGRPHLRADGANEASKGIWVMQGADCTVENIEFSGSAVPDHNGAGIRAETKGTLTIRNCDFHGNENGILGPDDPDAELVVESSTFTAGGSGDGLSHNMYIGRIRSFKLIGSYSHLARVGHNVKSRARRNSILYCRIMDELSGSASYEIDLPEGGRSFLIGNIVQKGASAENSAIISYAAENANAGLLELYVVNNTIVNDRPAGGRFLQLRSGTKATVVNNILYGPGVSWTTDGVTVIADHNYIETSRNNSPRLADPASFDYRLLADSPCRDAGVLPGIADGEPLAPEREYSYDARTVPRAAFGAIDIGAFEYRPAVTGSYCFPQVAVGGGYSTVFSLTNVGAGTAVGTLVLTDESGKPAPLSAMEAGFASYPLSIPAAGMTVIVAAAAGASDPIQKGWARIETSGGSVHGIATFQSTAGGVLLDAVGVLGSRPTASAAIPIDNDETARRFVGFAVANPGTDALNISVTARDQDGRRVETLSPPELNPLRPGRQVSRFVHEYQKAWRTFRGSLVLWTPDGGEFAVVALVEDQGRYTAIPAIPTAAPR